MSSRQRSFDITADTAYFGILAALLALSIFFGVSVELQRNRWFGLARQADLPSGSEVVFVLAIDGDEVSVRRADDKETDAFVVRLLGIKAFDTNFNDPIVAAVGQSALHTLERRALEHRGKKAVQLRVVYDDYALDAQDRLLAYLHLGSADDGEASDDLGLSLVENGAALVYTKYPFSRSADYLAVQRVARRRQVGLWGLPDVVERADALQAKWQAEARP